MKLLLFTSRNPEKNFTADFPVIPGFNKETGFPRSSSSIGGFMAVI
jgi:hypothetical protein